MVRILGRFGVGYGMGWPCEMANGAFIFGGNSRGEGMRGKGSKWIIERLARLSIIGLHYSRVIRANNQNPQAKKPCTMAGLF